MGPYTGGGGGGLELSKTLQNRRENGLFPARKHSTRTIHVHMSHCCILVYNSLLMDHPGSFTPSVDLDILN